MDREGFRNRLKQYKEAKGFDPLLSYWEWKLKYDSAPQPDSMPGQPQPDLPTAASQHLDDRAHRWDNGYSNANRDPFDSPYDDSRYHDYRKPRFEFRKGDVHYSNPNVLKWMGRFGKVLRGGSLLGEAVQNLFPSEEAELIEDLRVKMDKQNKWLTGLEDIPKYDEGTNSVWVPTEEEMLRSKKKNLTDYRSEDFPPMIRFFGEEDHIKNVIRKRVNDPNAFSEKQFLDISDKYYTPFLKDKKIVLTDSENLTGATLSENLLDSIYKYSKIVGIPLLDAVGLAALESTFGKYEGWMDPTSKMSVLAATGDVTQGFDPIKNLHNHTFVDDVYYSPVNEARNWFYRKSPNEHRDTLSVRAAKELETNPNYYILEGVKRYHSVKNPWIHAFELYKHGKYNTNDKHHTSDVQHAGKLVLEDPAVQKWVKENNIKYAEGGEVTDPRQKVLKRANRVATNYSDAMDFTLDPFNYAVRKIAKTLTGRGGISNCTLSATGWIDPNNQYMSAKNIFDNPSSGYTEIDKAYALPGDLLIAKNPKEGSYHTMLIESFNGDDPVLRYSRGGHNTEKNLVTGRSLEEYHRLDNEQGGNHTEDHYFRYNFPNEYWLPEMVVTPKK